MKKEEKKKNIDEEKKVGTISIIQKTDRTYGVYKTYKDLDDTGREQASREFRSLFLFYSSHNTPSDTFLYIVFIY